jgi:hypothetical protein
VIVIAGVLLLLCLSGCLATFVLLLARKDLSPRIALEKIQNRLRKQPPAMLPNFGDAPYRRLTDHDPKHHPTLVNLQTSEGSGQACHPDVAYIPDGFGSGRWPYLMICTPYAYANFVQENPEIFASYDGVHWTVPDGVTNPVIPSPPGSWDHNSDPDMLFLDGKLWLYYRETRRSSSPAENRIYLTTSVDGVEWSSPVEVLAARGDAALLMSPAVVHDDDGFHMWTVERAESRFQVVRRDSADGFKWNSPLRCSLIGLTEREPWHLDVIREAGTLSALLVSLKGQTDWRLHYAYSLDGGNTWNVEGFLLELAYEFEEAFHYRATLLKTRSTPPHTYQIWYSAANRREMFSIAYQTLVRESRTLKPVPGIAQLDLAVTAPQ